MLNALFRVLIDGVEDDCFLKMNKKSVHLSVHIVNHNKDGGVEYLSIYLSIDVGIDGPNDELNVKVCLFRANDYWC